MSFGLELHGEWSEPVDECIGLFSTTEALLPILPCIRE
jgi:hypothetical protein